MTLYTRGGDEGKTSLYGGKRVKKQDPVIHAVGTIDELNSAIGVAASFAKDRHIQKVLETIQHRLFHAQSEMAKGPNVTVEVPVIELKHVAELEEHIDYYEAKMPKQEGFILPGGSQQASFLHLARTVCRRAERIVWSAGFRGQTPQYLNRLSTLLFILARASNKGDVGVTYE
ncbi:ATP:cob(I)alamin adenosyltransferase [Candidatus Woesearchaeota archaeon]|nr:ATP:cob(I)alamin adenosyltransferase [Candidatus Woesearchaeota archaeon]|tara:strand:+ start:446 stop:964 length:519 start_codon:yes stop_codon:yes gene_type:complete